MCFLAPVAEEIIFRVVFIKQQYRLGSRTVLVLLLPHRFCNYAYTILPFCGDFVYLFVFSSIYALFE
ncbi:hypothetical protein KCP76_01585 [Salmonella enterica subsp. enterica serovar Weltevreden]|nr:hypothetical protein KCP76_01585 [Salmonella enterica subsp. enterica serovar Weltevreden]